MLAKLILEDGTEFEGESFGSATAIAGEVVFNTGMVGYPECFTDPSYEGQILNLTFPLIGNYGVPKPELDAALLEQNYESNRIHISGLVVSQLSNNFSHWRGFISLDEWLKKNKIPGISGIDTRKLTQVLREKGAMLGKLVQADCRDIDFADPNQENLVARVSRPEPVEYGNGSKRIVLVDCGCKNNIIRSLLKRDVRVKVVPWNWDLSQEKFDGVMISNGPGDPKMCTETISNIQKLFSGGAPVFGICLGNQLLSLAAGAGTYKLKYGHRGQNQPCVKVGTKRCYITSQNHGFAVDDSRLPAGWEPLFFNANDGTNEGIRHQSKPFVGVQFHPEAAPGPLDTAYLFDEFIDKL